jgi:nitroimidazol reductase NimA-like FMN-containing flavoprotein (pyridoxamine 5'-phosphate oxidase superfamily)
MAVPVTEIDSRFSDPSAAATEWEHTQAVLASAQLSWLATVRADGRPHVTPLVAVWLDGSVHFGTGPAEQKAVNLRANPHVTLTTGCNGWDAGLDVVVEGVAERVTAAADLERLAAAWREKWDGRWQYEVGDGCFGHEDGEEVLVFAVRPAKVLAFGKEPFSHTRHMFWRDGAWLI